MQPGISLQQLAAQIEGTRPLKHDLIADTSAVEMTVDTDGVTTLDIAGTGAGSGSFPIRPIAHSQIGSRLSIPSKYYGRMLNGSRSDRKLLASNVNHWFKATPEKRMIRTLGGDLSAWGLLNAVTNQAHTISDYDRAFEFEKAGGAILDLSRKDWREILEAA